MNKVLDSLSVMYNIWLEINKLPKISADELIYEDNLTGEQKEWLKLFIDLWEKTGSMRIS